MTWRVIAQRYDSGEMSNTNNSIPFKPNKSIVLDAITVWVLAENNPTYTNITASIYSDRGGSPRSLIASSSTTKTKAQIQTLNNAMKEVGFDFSNVMLQSGTTYHIVLSGAGYTPTASSALYLVKKYDNPYNHSTLTTNPTSMARIPGDFTLIGSEL